MNICFLVWSPDISGGTNVIFEHATRLKRMGENVTIITEEVVCKNRLKWFPGAEELEWKTYKEVKDRFFDLCFATWWKTVFQLKLVNSRHYLYFVQSIESKFYPESDVILRNLVELTYSLDLKIITEATWIQDYLLKNYGKEAYLVKNGIRKEFFNCNLKPIENRCEDKLRVIVEGPLGVPFKNTELALKLVNESNADEVWLLTSTEIGAYPKVDRLFSRVPISKVGTIYSSCDVLVKLSTVEGMFGPPLEMYHCGGTSISYDVTGYDEYIVHGKNGLVSFSRDNIDIVNKINSLKAEKTLLKELKYNALSTAESWPDWNDSSNKFMQILSEIHSQEINQDIKKIGRVADLTYSMYEDNIKVVAANNFNVNALKIKFLTHLLEHYPLLFSIMRKTKWTLLSFWKK
ncbi:glycosyltransferase family 4 protein [Enterovibrio norvegicus]|uniref:glycosyltransferase family 4 protein n=1 Tax=Enterovibrio norvegicus TaxID=188144 RepID=UPI0024B0EA2A|nr:glycosyltransferase family 4 protein [Enterovibrio norvegicus]